MDGIFDIDQATEGQLEAMEEFNDHVVDLARVAGVAPVFDPTATSVYWYSPDGRAFDLLEIVRCLNSPKN